MSSRVVLRLAALVIAAISLTGCSGMNQFSGTGTSLRLSGGVLGGQQPVSGAAIQLYAVGTGGDGSAATALLLTPSTTDAYGNFDITGKFTCTSSSSQVYLVATGGNPGLSNGTNNAALALMAALGPCGSLTGSTRIAVNELTTVASLAALYPYASSPSAIGSSTADASALTAAFASVNEYTNISTGSVPGPTLPANTYASSNEIITLADIVAACVNSSGGVYNDGTLCGRLFLYAKPATSAAPTDTITAVIDILKNPTANVASIFGLVPSGGAPFQPALTAPPSDWTLPILPIPAPPTFSLAAGAYVGSQTVTLSDATPGAAIYYTLDGSTPTVSSPLYGSALTLSSSSSLKAIAVEHGGRTVSSLASAAYVINPPIASLLSVAGTVQTAKTGSPFATALQVQALSDAGQPVSGVTIVFSAPAANVTVTPAACTTNSSGLCSVTATASTALGTYTVLASAGSARTAFTLTNTGVHAYLVTNQVDFGEDDSACVDGATPGLSSNVQCTLRDALGAAASVASASAPATITFAVSSATTTSLARGTLNIPSYTTVQGPTSGSGPSLTNLLTINGSGSTIFTEASGVTGSAINNLVLTGGGASTASGSASNGLGGAIFMAGTLAINNSTLSANVSSVSGGAISNMGGALSINGSTFANNKANTGYGGAVDNYYNGTVNISNSTFYGNTAGADGGAIYSSGTAHITDSTVVGNNAPYGAGIYNLGTVMTVTNSIVNGNTNQDCGGIYCASNWAYVVFSYAGTQVVDSNNVTIAFTDTLGNSFSQTVAYGQFSMPASFASSFGPYFYYNYSGLDTTPITGQSFGNLLVISPENGATLNPFTITNPGKSFTVTQAFYPFLLANSGNAYGLTGTQINLGSLANNGGPTQTMLPLSGSAALCLITPSTASGYDQRGQPRSVTVGSSTCQDAGAVQTSN